eukprot:3405929-Pyramimonas_sp.AAC.1
MDLGLRKPFSWKITSCWHASGTSAFMSLIARSNFSESTSTLKESSASAKSAAASTTYFEAAPGL